MLVNDDGSIDLYSGTSAPKGKEANRTQTISGRGFFMVFRLYTPKEAWHEKTWRSGEIELIK